ncbi:MAG: hypothetical protein ABMA64_24525 [Myxococcota bacterium]
MNNIDPNSLIRLFLMFNDLGDAAAAALLAVMGHPTVQHKIIAEKYGIHPKTISRATAEAEAHGILHGKAGAWTITLPKIDGIPIDDEPNAGVKMAAAFKELDRESRTWKSHTYKSRLERDTAFILSTSNVKFTHEVSYKTFIPTCDRAWTCDFVVELDIDVGIIKIGIECTARADAAATVTEKVTACSNSNFTLILIDSNADLIGLRARLRDEREKAKARAQAAASTNPPIDTTKPYETASGRFINPLGIRRSGRVPQPLFISAPATPLPVLTPEQIESRELARAQAAMDDAEYEEIKAAAQAAREAKQAEIAAHKAAQSDEERGRALAAALRARDERERPRTAPVRTEPDSDDGDIDPEVEAIARAEGCDDAIDIERDERTARALKP